jgi:hypothetical protein
MLDKAPAPFNTDYYVVNNDETVRGTAVHMIHTIDAQAASFRPATKVSHNSVDQCVVPTLPTDPLYVLPRSRFTVHKATGTQVANSIFEGLRSICPVETVLNAHLSKAKISVLIPNSLDLKIKMYMGDNGDIIVTFRKDSGDWFVFIHIFSAIKKYFRNNSGMSIESSH